MIEVVGNPSFLQQDPSQLSRLSEENGVGM
jgi:hypothetical protein